MTDLTQEEVDSAFLKIKHAWDKVIQESGMTEVEFIEQDETGCADYYFKRQGYLKDQVEKMGLTVPDLNVH